MKTFIDFGHRLHHLLHNPWRVLWICLVFISVSLLLNGSLIRIYSLNRDERRLREQTESVRSTIVDLERQLKQAQDPAFLERQALDRYDLAEENDLVFVFSDE